MRLAPLVSATADRGNPVPSCKGCSPCRRPCWQHEPTLRLNFPSRRMHATLDAHYVIRHSECTVCTDWNDYCSHKISPCTETHLSRFLCFVNSFLFFPIFFPHLSPVIPVAGYAAILFSSSVGENAYMARHGNRSQPIERVYKIKLN